MGYDALSFKIGIAMGHISPARSMPQREPVAYNSGDESQTTNEPDPGDEKEELEYE